MTVSIAPAVLEVREQYTAAEARLLGWLAGGKQGCEERLREALSRLLVRPGVVEVVLHMRHWLDASKPPLDIVLKDGESLIGREEHCQLVLEESVVHREHARITVHGQELTIEDLGSRLGTFIGDRKLDPNTPARIAPGVAFTIFPYTLRLELSRTWEREDRIGLGAWKIAPYSKAPSGMAAAVRLPGLGEEIGLYLSRELGTELAAAMLGVDDLPAGGSLDVDIECFAALLQAVAARLLPEAVEVELRKPVFQGPALLLEGAIEIRGRVGAAAIVLPESAVERLRAIDPPRNPLPGVPFACRALLAEVELASSEAAALEPGDIVLCEADLALVPAGDCGQWSCTTADSNFSRLVINKWLGRRVTASDNNSSPLNGLTVRLQAILAEREFTYAELEALVPGSIVELGRGDGEPVQLALNGRLMGRGELVRVDGRLGVRIVDWHA
ncbi:MAG: FliM/FliN family flagellar motor switch protein [Bryobacteraceae bacterium]|nr:FliM/FliN family flagellar motor switch protein [Bryobacteraceae bacterium]